MTEAERERAAIVAWLRTQAHSWEARSRSAAKKFGTDSRTTHATASIAASYQDHADAIASGAHLNAPDLP